MKYILIGFFLAIGWNLGEAVLRVTVEKLLAALKSTKEYEAWVAKRQKTKENENNGFKPTTVKNQIGFR